MPAARIDFDEVWDPQKVDFLSLTPQLTYKKKIGILVAKIGPFRESWVGVSSLHNPGYRPVQCYGPRIRPMLRIKKALGPMNLGGAMAKD